MAQLWPADGGGSFQLDLSDSQWNELESLLHFPLDRQSRLLTTEACLSYLGWEYLQDAAAGKPSEAVAWLERVKKCAQALADALDTKRNHAERVAASHLRVEMRMDFEVMRRGLTHVRGAAERAQGTLHITDADGRTKNAVLDSLIRWLANIVEKAGGEVRSSGGDGRSDTSPFVSFLYGLINTFPRREHRKNHSGSEAATDRVQSKVALAKRVERALANADKSGGETA
jgi:hypothetical protein